MSQFTVNANQSIVTQPATTPAAGLAVLFGGVEVYEVRARELGWRRVLIAAGLAGMIALSAFAWSRVAAEETTPTLSRVAALTTALAALYAMWAVRQSGMVWRFDHKRKTITRRHWMRGMSRSWNAKQVSGVRLLDEKSRAGAGLARIGLVDATGKVVAELGRWDKSRVDLNQLQSVTAEIKKVMWWK